MQAEVMTHEVTCSFEHGSVTFQIAAYYHGEGDYAEGIEQMIHENMFPHALSVNVWEFPT